jgi:hypothetical protein
MVDDDDRWGVFWVMLAFVIVIAGFVWGQFYGPDPVEARFSAGVILVGLAIFAFFYRKHL